MPLPGGGDGPIYRIHFKNRFARGAQTWVACQRSVEIRSAKTRDRAIEAAKRRFARQEGIRDWRIHASALEVEVIDDRSPPSSEEIRVVWCVLP
jgi:hypothetical protein